MKRRRYLIDDSTHPIFVTTTVVQWMPVFSDINLAEYALKTLEKVRSEFAATIFGFVLMPEHFHAIIPTGEKGFLSLMMKRWKGNTSRFILQYSAKNHREWLVRFNENARLYKLPVSQHNQVWQPRFDEKAIRDEREFLAKLNYIHGNPIKHNLVDDYGGYPYSSHADYEGEENGFVTVQCGYNLSDKKR